MQTNASCPICRRVAEADGSAAKKAVFWICDRCGHFGVRDQDISYLNSVTRKASASRRFSRYIRQIQFEMGEHVVLNRRIMDAIRRSKRSFRSNRVLHQFLRFVSDASTNSDVGFDLDCWAAITNTASEAKAKAYLGELEALDLIALERHGDGRIGISLKQAGRNQIRRDDPKSDLLERRIDAAPLEKTPDCAAYVRSLTIENVKCFKASQAIHFTDDRGKPARWSVILGENGVGKTTILQMIAQLFPVQDGKRNQDYAFPIGSNGSVSSSFDDQIMDLAYARLLVHPAAMDSSSQVEVVTIFSKSREISSILAELLVEFERFALTSAGRSVYATGSTQEFRQPTPIAGYGANRGVFVQSSNKEETGTSSVTTLFASGTSLRLAEDWLLSADYAARFDGPESSRSKSRLERVEAAILKVLPDVSGVIFLPPDAERTNPEVRFSTPYGSFKFSQLSLGYQSTLTWVIDLIARLVDIYPESSDPLNEPVVILIDEIDLHLHPKWQRRIMTYLETVFGAAQFIVTTHSPLIVQGTRDVNLIVLKRDGDQVKVWNDLEAARSWRADQILTSDLFDLPSAHPDYIQGMLDRRKRLMSRTKLNAAEEDELKKIDAALAGVPSAENQTDIRAMEIIRRAAENLSH